MYQRYQKKWVSYALEHKLNKSTNKDLLDKKLYEFFVGFGKEYAPSTLYVMYSCINHYFISNFGYKLNKMLRLQRYLKHNTSTYVCKKSKVFTSEQIDQILKHSSESHDPKEILTGVGISLMYYGLLRVCDSLKIQKKDVSHQSNGRVVIKFEHARKRRNAGFTYHVPSLYSDLFKKYENQLPKYMTEEDLYLRVWIKKDQERSKIVKKWTTERFVVRACSILGIDSTGYTSHCFRRSAATNLADAGVSFINLKRHGQWKSDSVAEQYIANSKVLRDEREVCLLPESMRLPYKRAGFTQELNLEALRTPFSQFGEVNNIFELLTPPDSTQASYAPKDPPKVAKKMKLVTYNEMGKDDNSFFSQDEPIVNLLKKQKKAGLKRKEENKTEEHQFQHITPLKKQSEEVVYLKTVTPEKIPLEDEADKVEKDLIKVERVVSGNQAFIPSAVPSLELVESKTSPFLHLEDRILEKLGDMSKDEVKPLVFNNCTFHF